VERLFALLDEKGADGESAGKRLRDSKDRCAAPLKDLLEELPERYVEEDFFDLGVSSPEVFPASARGTEPPEPPTATSKEPRIRSLPKFLNVIHPDGQFGSVPSRLHDHREPPLNGEYSVPR
jgi:hypothetical protein